MLALVVIAAAAAILLLRGEDEFAKAARPILEPVQQSAGALGDALESVDGSENLPAAQRAAADLERTVGRAQASASELKSSDEQRELVLDFLGKTEAFARQVQAAAVELSTATATRAEEASQEAGSARDRLASAGEDLALPAGDDYEAAERLSALAKRCGGIPPGAVAVVAGRVVSQAEITRLIAQAKSSFEAQGSLMPERGTAEYKHFIDEAMEFIIQRIQFEIEAERMGIEVTAADVRRRFRSIKRKFFGRNEADYRRQLRKQHLTEEQVLRDVRAEVIEGRIFRRATAGAKDKELAMHRWVKAMRERYAGEVAYRSGYEPSGKKGWPSC